MSTIIGLSGSLRRASYSDAGKIFDAQGRLTDAGLRERVHVYAERFAAFVAGA